MVVGVRGDIGFLGHDAARRGRAEFGVLAAAGLSCRRAGAGALCRGAAKTAPLQLGDQPPRLEGRELGIGARRCRRFGAVAAGNASAAPGSAAADAAVISVSIASVLGADTAVGGLSVDVPLVSQWIVKSPSASPWISNSLAGALPPAIMRLAARRALDWLLKLTVVCCIGVASFPSQLTVGHTL
jgi:hypothetical protein